MTDDRKQSLEEWLDNQPHRESSVAYSVVIPAWNEEWRLPPTLIDVIDYFDSRDTSYEIIVVDDGSSDNTVQVVKKFMKLRSLVRLIRLPRNYGKGHAVRTGMLNAYGELVLFTDADGSTPIAEIERLEQALDESDALIAIGSRAKASSKTQVNSRWYRKVLGRSFNFLVNQLLLPNIADTQCGFKLFKRDAAQFVFSTQQCDEFGFDLEILYIALRAKLTFVEVPVNWTHVSGSKVNLVLDAIKMFRDIFVFRVRHRSISEKNYLSLTEKSQTTKS